MLFQDDQIKNVSMEVPMLNYQEILNHHFKVSKEEKAAPKHSILINNHMVRIKMVENKFILVAEISEDINRKVVLKDLNSSTEIHRKEDLITAEINLASLVTLPLRALDT